MTNSPLFSSESLRLGQSEMTTVYEKAWCIKHRMTVLLSFFLSASLQGQLSQQIQSIRNQFDLMGGVVVLFCHDSIVHHVPFGWADYGRQIPVTDSTVFRIASISKTVTAIGYMKLVDQGLADPDGDISNVLGFTVRNPFYPNQPVTARMLLSHTSSIVDGNTYSNFLNATYNLNPIPDLSEILTPGGAYYSTSNYNNVQPGSYFNYANLNYVILGTLIEKITGRRFDEYMRDSILLPAGVEGSYNVNHLSNIDRVAVLYRKINGNWVPQADDYQGVQPVYSNLNGYVPGTNGGRFSPQGGLRCSGKDLSRLFQMILKKGLAGSVPLLSSASVQQMLANVWTYNGNNGNNYYDLFNSYGLGIHRALGLPGKDVVLPSSSLMFGHPGEAYGLVSDAYVDTIRRLGLVFITNGCGAGYQVSALSAYYTVEKAVFDVLSPYADAMDCLKLTTLAPTKESFYELYPNPAEELVFLSLQKAPPKGPYEIFNAQGKLVSAGNLETSGGTISLSHVPSGIYVLSFQATDYYPIKLRIVKK